MIHCIHSETVAEEEFRQALAYYWYCSARLYLIPVIGATDPQSYNHFLWYHSLDMLRACGNIIDCSCYRSEDGVRYIVCCENGTTQHLS